MDNNLVLSICIPTYNGCSSYLKEVIESAFHVISMNDDVEVVVSDNCSNDSTWELLKSYEGKNNYRVYRNDSNKGFNGNMLLLADHYAKGRYCWFVGDDDVINIDYFSVILDVLRNHEIDLLTLKFGVKNEPANYIIDNTPVFCSFGKAVDNSCITGNTLCAYMGSAIFKRDKFNNYSKDFLSNSFDTFYNAFPNAYLIASIFHGSRCAHLSIPAITVYIHNKDWASEDNYYKIVSVYFVDLYNYILSLGIPRCELTKNYQQIIFSNLLYGYKRVLSGKMVNKFFFFSMIMSFTMPSVIVRFIKSIYSKMTKK